MEQHVYQHYKYPIKHVGLVQSSHRQRVTCSPRDKAEKLLTLLLFKVGIFFFLGPNKHSSAVTCLQFNKKFVITSSDDGTVKIWDLKTGEFLRNLVALDSGGSGGVVWRVRCSNSKLVCAVGSRNGTEETKLHVLDFDVDEKKCLY